MNLQIKLTLLQSNRMLLLAALFDLLEIGENNNNIY